jgi:hypothetical protein
MTQSDSTSRRPGLWTAFASAAVAGASALTIALPPTSATADPVPPPPTTTTAPAAPATPAPPPAPADPNAAPAPAAPPPPPADPNAPPPPAAPAPPPPPADPNAPPPPAAPAPPPAPADPNAPPPPPADPNAPPPPPADPNAPPPPAAPGPADPNAPAPAPAPEAGRIENGAGGFSYILPAGWEVADASRLSYGQALLLKPTGPAPLPGQQATTANDTSILLGRLDMKLFAGAEQDNTKAAVRLASDMGEFFMPFPGTRLNQATTPLQAGDMAGFAASYDVKFTDTAKPNGQIWAGVVGDGAARGGQPPGRWFVVWLGTSKDGIDAVAAKDLAQSIRPYSPPAPPPAPAPDPNAPAAPPAAPGVPPVGVPVPITTPVPGMTPGT